MLRRRSAAERRQARRIRSQRKYLPSVQSLEQRQLLASSIIDDGDSGFVASGNWVPIASPGYSFNDDFRYGASAGTNGSSTATWTFDNLTPGQYLVAATWEPLINRATNAP
ncbi:hypothetical protein [Singulisphaera sp. GP187]|uniref:hypothetical protein n=1 Tax=Singulisphaera sp. GP187 TaxID=1882752 RepID=UPI00094111A2|nr:hypothetical protein [Singulisphaera sp. GP187]